MQLKGKSAKKPNHPPTICILPDQVIEDAMETVVVIVQNMASEIFVHACHILKWADICLVANTKKLSPLSWQGRTSILKI